MRIRIRTKLAAALAVPLIALVAVASQEVSQASERADEVVQEAELATAAAGPTSVISRLQDERNFALIELLGMVGTLELPVASTEEARANTDAAFTELQEFVDARGGDVEDAFARTIEGIDLFLAAVRGQVDLYDGPQDLSIQTVEFALTIYNAYAAFINTIVTDTSGIALDVADADLRTGVELVSRTTNDLEYSAEINRNIFYQSLTASPLDDARIIVAGHLDDYLTQPREDHGARGRALRGHARGSGCSRRRTPSSRRSTRSSSPRAPPTSPCSPRPSAAPRSPAWSGCARTSPTP